MKKGRGKREKALTGNKFSTIKKIIILHDKVLNLQRKCEKQDDKEEKEKKRRNKLIDSPCLFDEVGDVLHF